MCKVENYVCAVPDVLYVSEKVLSSQVKNPRLSFAASRANRCASSHHSARDEHRASAAHCVREIPIAVNGRGFSRRRVLTFRRIEL